MKKAISLLLLSLLTGCMVGPDYAPPCIDAPQEWNTKLDQDCTFCDLQWWSHFNDPVLDELIVLALNENKDLLIATERINEFFGFYRITRSRLFPQIFADTNAGRQKISTNVTPLTPGIGNPDNLFELLVQGSWELDLWGRLRRETEASYAELLAAEEARQSVIQTLIASLATSYIDLLRLDRQLVIALETTKTRRDTLELFQLRYDAGVISKLILSQIKSEYEDAKASIPVFEKAVIQQEYLISILLGRNPGPIPRGGTLNELLNPEIPCGLPSDLLTQRPDIREAENLLIAANARIGVARAAYFPDISLTGAYGYSSRELGDLITQNALAWNFFVPTTTPIFTAGALRGQLDASISQKEQALLNYLRRIQDAFKEVEDALVDIQKTKEQLATQEKQVESLQTYADLARLRYDDGYTSYLEVLDAERSLFNVQLAYSETQSNLFIAYANLYKAMGGSWIQDANCLIYK